MTIMHHPSASAFGAFASGTLDEARAVVVATHLSLCPQCRSTMAGVRATRRRSSGCGADCADERRRARTRLGAHSRLLQPQRTAVRRHVEPATYRAPLANYALGSWRWIGRGVQWRSVDVASDDGVRVFMLKAAPGTRLPRHRHTGTEWTCVFEGAFRHDLGRYGAGDFDEADESDRA